jgi:hypothetical protein
MARIAPIMVVLILLAGCEQKPAPTTARAPKDPKIAAIEERIAQTTPEGKQVIDKVQGIKPEVNEQPSTKTLGEMVEHYSKNMGAYDITPIGWEASQKKSGKWKVVFNYQDYQKQIRAAEWEYDPATGKLYPFEKENAKDFWSSEGADKVKKGKK